MVRTPHYTHTWTHPSLHTHTHTHTWTHTLDTPPTSHTHTQTHKQAHKHTYPNSQVTWDRYSSKQTSTNKATQHESKEYQPHRSYDGPCDGSCDGSCDCRCTVQVSPLRRTHQVRGAGLRTAPGWIKSSSIKRSESTTHLLQQDTTGSGLLLDDPRTGRGLLPDDPRQEVTSHWDLEVSQELRFN